jgi:hypothetical protein
MPSSSSALLRWEFGIALRCTTTDMIRAIACTSANDGAAVVAPKAPSLAKSTATDPTATYRFPFNGPTLGIQGDGEFSDGTYSVYDKDVCGVTTRIYATTEASNSGDMMFQTLATRTKDQRCAVYPRRIRVAYPDGLSELTYSTTNLQRVENTTFQIPVGATVKRQLNMGTGESVRCSGIRWGANTGSSVVGDSVLVTRTALDTWHVQTQPAPNNRGVCLSSSPTAYNLSVDFWVVSDRPLP